MGGINCSNALQGQPDPATKRAYTKSLAKYCDSLFTGTANFFAANAAIERAVLDDGSLDDAVQLLTQSEQGVETARSQIGAVASMHGQLAPNHDVDFGEQLMQLDGAARAIRTARMELELIAGGESLQDKLWAAPGLTPNFVDAMSAVMAANSWQGKFATSHTLVYA